MQIGTQPYPYTTPSGTALGGKLVPELFTSVTATYPATDTEVYTYALNGTNIAVVTVVYTDSTKEVLTSVTRTNP